MPEQLENDTVQSRFRFRPISLAVGYLIFGILWTVFSDAVLFIFIDDTALQLQIETFKGILFVLVSSILGFLFLSLAYREYENVNELLRRSVREVSILHRILRHNLRNSATVILGNLDLLEVEDGSEQALETLRREANELVDLVDRADYLNELNVQEEPHATSLDVIPELNEAVQSCRETYPNADIDVRAPQSLRAPLPEHIGFALSELLENAIIHNDAEQPRIRVWAGSEPDGQITLAVEDNGPGIPEVEQQTFQAGYERMLEHSRGLDLWMVKLITEIGGGTLQFGESDFGGARVEMQFPMS